MTQLSVRRVVPNNWTELESSSTVDIDEVFSRCARIISNCEPYGETCWRFKSNTERAQREFNGKPELVYRTVFMVFHDCIWPEPACRHLCGFAGCVNFNHLWPGDTLDNTLDNEYQADVDYYALAPKDWYELGKRETQSVASVFSSFLDGSGWGNSYGYYLDKYNIYGLIDNIRGKSVEEAYTPFNGTVGGLFQ